jgi:hypothetical protein
LNNVTKQFGIKTSALKSKALVIKGHVPIRSKIVIDNTVLKQIISQILDVKFSSKRKGT